jgi:PAS domain-containing protein
VSPRSSVSKYLERPSRAFRLSGPPSTDDTAKVLHYLLLTLFTWNGLWTIVLLPYSTGHPPQLTAISLIEAALGAALVKLRGGSLQAASWIYLTGIWVFATVVIAQNGGIRSVVLSLYVTLPVSAAWLLGYRASLWTTAVCMGSALVFAVLESAGVRLPRTIPGTAIGIWIQLAGAVLMSVIPLTQVLRRLSEALKKVHEQFESLQRQDDKLRESEEQFRTVADTAPVMIVVTDRDKFASFVNKAWL